MMGVHPRQGGGSLVEQERPGPLDPPLEELDDGARQRQPLPPTEHVLRSALVRFIVSSVIAVYIVILAYNIAAIGRISRLRNSASIFGTLRAWPPIWSRVFLGQGQSRIC